jgi:hypothetical protein
MCITKSTFSCDDVTCSGHGSCSLAAGYPTCACESGFAALGLNCIQGCSGTSCCPLEMVAVQFSSVSSCVDRYEATVFAAAACSGTRYGEGILNDYPVGFPATVESADCVGTCNTQQTVPATADLYACSVPDVRPSANISWFQAKRACENSGKRLCTGIEQLAACSGPEGWAQPYGPTWDDTYCNFQQAGLARSMNAGSMTLCEGAYSGLFDMLGNLTEWTADCDTGFCLTYGGSYGNTFIQCGGHGGPWAHDGNPTVGFRCCRSL